MTRRREVIQGLTKGFASATVFELWYGHTTPSMVGLCPCDQELGGAILDDLCAMSFCDDSTPSSLFELQGIGYMTDQYSKPKVGLALTISLASLLVQHHI